MVACHGCTANNNTWRLVWSRESLLEGYVRVIVVLGHAAACLELDQSADARHREPGYVRIGTSSTGHAVWISTNTLGRCTDIGMEVIERAHLLARTAAASSGHSDQLTLRESNVR